MIEDVCPATPPYRHLAALLAVIDQGIDDEAINVRALITAYIELDGCPACLAAVGREVRQ